MVDPHGWHALSVADANRIKSRLAAFETMRWKEILFHSAYRNHMIPVTRLAHSAQERLRILEQDDIDAVISLGITQMERVFGILEHNVLKVLWWDPNHMICPVEKPNT